jgi:phosphoglycerate dehydrogenase-like enzyme
MRIVIPDQISLTPAHFKTIKSLGNVTIYEDIPKTDEEIIRRIKDAEIVTANWANLNSKIIDGAKNLKFIVVPAVGYEWVDVKYATKKGIKVLNCPTHNADAVANMAIGFILSTTRKVKEANKSLEDGEWDQTKYRGIELNGRTLGLIGYGNIGKRVAIIAKLLGMKVKYANSKTSPKEVDEIIKTSDILSLHMPLNGKTKNIIDSRRIKMMKKGSYLINVSRGGLIDQKALVQALKSGHIAGAGLDVFQNEPFGKSVSVSKEVRAIAKMDNVIATPHIAYNTQEMFERMGDEIISDIKSCIKGKPINVVNR